jgi:hypothetical protein
LNLFLTQLTLPLHCTHLRYHSRLAGVGMERKEYFSFSEFNYCSMCECIWMDGGLFAACWSTAKVLLSPSQVMSASFRHFLLLYWNMQLFLFITFANILAFLLNDKLRHERNLLVLWTMLAVISKWLSVLSFLNFKFFMVLCFKVEYFHALKIW